MALIWRSRPDRKVRTTGCIGCVPIPVGCLGIVLLGALGLALLI